MQLPATYKPWEENPRSHQLQCCSVLVYPHPATIRKESMTATSFLGISNLVSVDNKKAGDQSVNAIKMINTKMVQHLMFVIIQLT